MCPDSGPEPLRLREPQTLDAFLSAIGPRAFRFAEAGLRHREDALDAVQEAMLRMLGYRARPAEEWTPLFWSILRSRIIDAQRRRRFRLGWLGQRDPRDAESCRDWADPAPDPARNHDGREAWTTLAAALRTLGLAFEEIPLRFDGFGPEAQFKQRLRQFTPSGVSCLSLQAI